ncbi:MAG: hypothetical protein JNL28_08400 [Planctomycetes bacterium]|nr:hypothetical protein [Planctomycetota bacterium]
MTDTRTGLQKYAALAVRLAALWLATGALFKLFAGSPKMLPELVRDYSPFPTWTLTFQVAIAVELSIVCIAVLKPHWGWMWITGTFGFFLVLLTGMMAKGVASCGCLGDSVSLPPWVMMCIDGVLLAFVLATKPWKSLAPPGLSTPLLALGIAASLALPWIVIQPQDAVVPPLTNGTEISGTPTDPQKSPSRVYIQWDPIKWKNKFIYDVAEFTRLVPEGKIPSDGRIVLWRQSCDHCAKHLREMADEKEATQPILLVQVMDDLKSGRAVDAMPVGAHVTTVELPPGEGLFTTPVEIRVAGGTVTDVLYEEDFEKLRAGK